MVFYRKQCHLATTHICIKTITNYDAIITPLKFLVINETTKHIITKIKFASINVISVQYNMCSIKSTLVSRNIKLHPCKILEISAIHLPIHF